MLDLLAAVTAECEALLARGPLPDGLGHGDAFERLLQLLRECVPTDPARR